MNFTTPLELLVAAILSARATDRKVNEVTPALFTRYRAAGDYAAAEPQELERLIRPAGFQAKARRLIAVGQALCGRFGGEVPDTLDQLLTLPGVGRKTALLVLGNAFNQPSLVVDTHFARLARRFGWTAHTDLGKIEQDVGALLPRPEWTAAPHRLTWHDRRVCHARRPACGACGVAVLCPSFSIGPTDEATARKLVQPGPFSWPDVSAPRCAIAHPAARKVPGHRGPG